MTGININNLTEEQRTQLREQFKQEEKDKAVRIKEDRKTLKELASKTVDEMFITLTNASSMLSKSKLQVFDSFRNLIDMKCDLYQVKDQQQSHTFSNAEGTKRIILGYRVMDRYDETADAGIAKVREYIDSLAKDNDSAKLVNVINSLLKRDTKGNLKASRVMELQKLVEQLDNDTFTDGVQIIMDAHRPEKSAYFVEAEWRDEEAMKWQRVALSISSADFPDSQQKKD